MSGKPSGLEEPGRIRKQRYRQEEKVEFKQHISNDTGRNKENNRDRADAAAAGRGDDGVHLPSRQGGY